MAEAIAELNDQTFDDAVKEGVVLVDFWAPWCGPCRMQGQIVDELAEKEAGSATFAKVNVDDAPSVAARYGVQAIPTLVVLKDGEIAQKFVGVQQAATLKSAIESAASA